MADEDKKGSKEPKATIIEKVAEPPKNDDVVGVAKVKAFLDAFPADIKDSYVLYGYDQYRLTVADLKAIANADAPAQ
jgi:hypothetical protein